METIAIHIDATAEPVAAMDRLGDEIAELSAHIEAAGAHLLDRIREFDARGGWNQGFRTCAHWVRALTRVATPETEARLLAVGKAGTACHVERIVRGWRRVDQLAEARETAQRHKTRALHVYEYEHGMVVIRGRLTPEAGAVLRQALAAARETLYQQTCATDPPCVPGDVSLEDARDTPAAGGRAGPAR